MLLFDIYKKYKFCNSADRVGPDMLFTHWMLHFKSSMVKLCKKKFKNFGEKSEFRPGAYAVYCSQITIGENVIIRPNTILMPDEFAEITIEDNVMIGMGVHCYVNNHKFERRDIPLIEQGYYPSKNILIKEGAWIGANSIILPGITIGKNAVVGAGSVVTKSVLDFTVVAGNPAKVIRKIGNE